MFHLGIPSPSRPFVRYGSFPQFGAFLVFVRLAHSLITGLCSDRKRAKAEMAKAGNVETEKKTNSGNGGSLPVNSRARRFHF